MTSHLTAKVWYARNTRDSMMGYSWLKKNGWLPDLETLAKSYEAVVEVTVGAGSLLQNLEAVFRQMQAENWSPRGEAAKLIASLGLNHTSMSVGDIIQVGNDLWMVDDFGFVNVSTGSNP